MLVLSIFRKSHRQEYEGALVSYLEHYSCIQIIIILLGILTQLAIVSGVMGTQIAGINLASPSHWRFVFLVSFFLSSVQLLSSSMVVESPAFLLTQQRPEDHKATAQRLWGSTASDSACKSTIHWKYIHWILTSIAFS